jgi:hypothetical protein
MRDNRKEYIRISLNHEVQSPPAVDASLPDALGLVVLLRAKRWMAEVAQ